MNGVATVERVASKAPSPYHGRADVDLVHAARDGDERAFTELVERFHERVYRLAYGMMKNGSDAEEVVQDTFLNMYRALPNFRGDSSPGTWIYRIASNSALMRLRTKRRKPLRSLDERPTNEPVTEMVHSPGVWAREPGEQLLDAELGERITSALGDLPDKYRAVLLLRDLEGLSNEETASVLGLTVPTVKSRLHRAREQVRGTLKGYVES